MSVIARCYGLMVTQYPVSGGEYAYAFLSFGPVGAYICGWSLLVAYIGIVAINATAVPLLFAIITPGLLQFGYMYTIAGYPVYIGEVIIPLLFIWGFGYLNIRGAHISGRVQTLLCIILVAAVVLISLGILMSGHFHRQNLTPFFGAFDKSFVKGLLMMVALTPFLYGGFDCIPQAAEEFNFSPAKTFKIMMTAILFASFITLCNGLIPAGVMPWTEMTMLTDAGGTPVAWRTGLMIEKSLGFYGLVFVVVAVLAGIVTGVVGMYVSSSRLFFSMARARMLPASLAYVHPAFSTPSHAIIAVTLICTITPFFGRTVLGWIIDMSCVSLGIGYFFTCYTAYTIVKNRKTEYSSKLSPLTALLGVIESLAILALLLCPGMPAFLSLPCWAALGGWFFVGLIFYILGRKNFKNISHGLFHYYIIGDEAQLTHAEKEQLKECSP